MSQRCEGAEGVYLLCETSVHKVCAPGHHACMLGCWLDSWHSDVTGPVMLCVPLTTFTGLALQYLLVLCVAAPIAATLLIAVPHCVVSAPIAH